MGLKEKRTSAVAADVSASGREEILGRLPGVLERYSALQVRGGKKQTGVCSWLWSIKETDFVHEGI